MAVAVTAVAVVAAVAVAFASGDDRVQMVACC